MEHPIASRRSFALPTLLKLAIGLSAGSTLLPLHAAPAAQAQVYRFEVPAQSLDAALAAYSAVTRMQVLVSAELTQGLQSPGLSGSYSQADALARLLVGTGLSASYIDADSVTLHKRGRQRVGPAAGRDHGQRQATGCDHRRLQLLHHRRGDHRQGRAEAQGHPPVRLGTDPQAYGRPEHHHPDSGRGERAGVGLGKVARPGHVRVLARVRHRVAAI